MINELKENELRELLESYNDYVMGFREEHDIDSEPVSIYEYYDNEYQLEKNKEYCGNCGKEKEDYESYLCDNCWEEEERRLYEDEETILPLKCVGVRDLKDNNGLKITLIDMNDTILNTFEFDIDIKRLNDMELYNLCYAISNRVNSLYYEYDGNLEREQVLNVVREELVK